MTNSLDIKERFEGCIVGGAIGDAWGSAYENVTDNSDPNTFYWAKKPEPIRDWAITDDTQLTLATCEILTVNRMPPPEMLAQHFLQYYRHRKLTGLGASTLKALRDLEAGAHWSQAGRSGEFAAGNGAAMRIAPFAFINEVSNDDIRNYCRITHRNDEAFVGALAVVIAIKEIIANNWTDNNLLELIIPQLPDTNVRDRLIQLSQLDSNTTISTVAKFGTGGYVVDSVPLAIHAASKIKDLGIESILKELIDCGGDTDTNASIAGQIMGSFIGINDMPENLLQKVIILNDYAFIKQVINNTILYL